MESIDTPEVDIVFKFTFTKTQKKELDIKDSEDVNGLYIYNYGKIFINVTSDDFKDSNEPEIIDMFSKVVTHETIHHIIHMLNNTYSNDTEEHLVLLMAEQEEWLK